MSEEIKQITSLLNKVGEIRKTDLKKRKESGKRFNIFNVLQVQRKELKHSLIIRDLLNPKGRHDQGKTYLLIFLEILKKKIKNKEALEILKHFEKPNTIKTFVEYNAGHKKIVEGGRIDILLKAKDKYYIVFENKVDADDQFRQLIRYKNYVGKNGLVLYLNKNGEEPKKHSYKTKESKRKEANEQCQKKVLDVEKDKDFFVISFKTEIKEWIEKCIDLSNDKPYIRENLNQYLEIIKSITNQLNSNYMSNKLKEYFTKNLDMLNDAKELTEYMNSGKFFEEMVGDKVEEIAKEIASEISNEENELVALDGEMLTNWRKYNSGGSNKILNFRFQKLNYFTLSFKPNSKIGYSNLIFTLRKKNAPNTDLSALKLKNNLDLEKKLRDTFGLQEDANIWLKSHKYTTVLNKKISEIDNSDISKYSNLETKHSIEAVINGNFKKSLKALLIEMFKITEELETQIID